jgi:predicted regulator of Ras-like GTPase activity (Roadblock/LC7/MglB family)
VTETGISDYFIFDEQRGADDERIPLVSPSAARVPAELTAAAGGPMPVVASPASTPMAPAPVAPASVAPPTVAGVAAPAAVATTPVPPTSPTAAAAPSAPAVPAAVQPAAAPAAPADVATPAAAAPRDTRPERLHAALDDLIAGSPDIEAAAVISLDGFTMASALPARMQEDRVGAMSAAILALGERASRELGKGKLTQVFIEGEGGYVMLMAAGSTAVLTCLASEEAKLGLVIYDMRRSVIRIAEIVG